MSFLLNIKSKYRLQFGLSILFLGASMLYFDLVPLDGFLAGGLLGYGLGLIVIKNKKKNEDL